MLDQTAEVEAIRVHANGATAKECTAIEDLLPPSVALVTSATNVGFSAAHNATLEAQFTAGVTHALVLNPDVVLDSNALRLLLDHARDHPGSLVGPLLELADPQTLEGEGRIDTAGIIWTRTGRHLDDRQGKPIASAPREPRRVAGISGACILVDRQAWERLVAVCGEFFDEDFIAYREDAEIGVRAGLVGVESWLVPAATGRHVRGLRGTRRGASDDLDALGVRNRFLLRFKLGPHRPGNRVLAGVRDVVVAGATITVERSSLPALRDAFRLRGRMRAKRRAFERYLDR